MDANFPSSDSDHQGWVLAAARWAEIVAIRWSLPGDIGSDDKERFNTAHQLIEKRFHEWMIVHYASLHSLSFLPRPVMLHQIPRYMAHRLAAIGSAAKLAVLVIDGFAMDQWAVTRQEMPLRKWVTEEFGLFAWVPTLTSVSRQSIFAGDPPFFFGAEPRHHAKGRPALDTLLGGSWSSEWRRGLCLPGCFGRRRCLYRAGPRKDRSAALQNRRHCGGHDRSNAAWHRNRNRWYACRRSALGQAGRTLAPLRHFT